MVTTTFPCLTSLCTNSTGTNFVIHGNLQEKKERLKKEGKLLTKSQRQQRAQAQAMLDSMKKQGT